MQITIKQYVVSLEGDMGSFSAQLSSESMEPGLERIHLRLESAIPERPPLLKLTWSQEAVGIHGVWDTDSGRRNNFIGSSFTSKSTSNAPVISLFDMKGDNRLTFAFSDVLNELNMVSWINEETAEYDCSITMFAEAGAALSVYEATLMLDTRALPFHQCLSGVTSWWEGMEGYAPSAVPDIARFPMYSTWYSFHQLFKAEEIEQQCVLAKQIGCEAIIVDDGWQTSQHRSAYAVAGDWEVSPERIADMKGHVAKVHEMGLKYILWYSVPFVGQETKAWSRFEGKYLGFNKNFKAATLDPRFPEVREYLIQTYERALLDWDLDGFKLDFVDYFQLSPDVENELGNGRDYDSIPAAVDRLLSDVMLSLSEIKADIMIEFRQTYVGPLMRKYGNLFRVSDCPNDVVMNRIGTLDLRLLSGNTAVHADMIMWHSRETSSGAALQLIHTMFAVPQISVRLDQVPSEHIQMLTYYLAFWREHREVLLHGEFIPERPDLLFPMVKVRNERKLIAAVYADYVVRLDELNSQDIWIVNGTLHNQIVIELSHALGRVELLVSNCLGEIVKQDQMTLGKGLFQVEIPSAGILCLKRSS